jgi:hypothetical protein
MTEEINIGKSPSGRAVIVRNEEGQWWIIVGDEYVHALWPRSRAVRFAHSIVRDKFF